SVASSHKYATIDTYTTHVIITEGKSSGDTATVSGTVSVSGIPHGAVSLIAVGADAGGGPSVNIYDGFTQVFKFGFSAYDPRFGGGVRVAVGDVNSDGIPDIITGPGPGGGPEVRVFDGSTGQLLPGPVGDFFAFDPRFTGGIYVAAGDVNGDGFADVIVGADAGGGPNVAVFSGKDGSAI